MSDLLFIVLCVPFTAADYALTSVWPFGDLWCSLVGGHHHHADDDDNDDDLDDDHHNKTHYIIISLANVLVVG